MKITCTCGSTFKGTLARPIPTGFCHTCVNCGRGWTFEIERSLEDDDAKLRAKHHIDQVEDKAYEAWKDYTKDHCPVCGELARSACRCPLNDRTCPNGHIWRRRTDGAYALLEEGHQEVSEEDWIEQKNRV